VATSVGAVLEHKQRLPNRVRIGNLKRNDENYNIRHLWLNFTVKR
jgi:hypothetical protein